VRPHSLTDDTPLDRRLDEALVKILPDDNHTIEPTSLVIDTTAEEGRGLDVEHIMHGLHEVETVLAVDVKDAFHAEDPSIGTSGRLGCARVDAVRGDGAPTISKAVEEVVQETHQSVKVHLAREGEAMGGEEVG
jgi:hypothetical protein